MFRVVNVLLFVGLSYVARGAELPEQYSGITSYSFPSHSMAGDFQVTIKMPDSIKEWRYDSPRGNVRDGISMIRFPRDYELKGGEKALKRVKPIVIEYRKDGKVTQISKVYSLVFSEREGGGAFRNADKQTKTINFRVTDTKVGIEFAIFGYDEDKPHKDIAALEYRVQGSIFERNSGYKNSVPVKLTKLKK